MFTHLYLESSLSREWYHCLQSQHLLFYAHLENCDKPWKKEKYLINCLTVPTMIDGSLAIYLSAGLNNADMSTVFKTFENL